MDQTDVIKTWLDNVMKEYLDRKGSIMLNILQ